MKGRKSGDGISREFASAAPILFTFTVISPNCNERMASSYYKSSIFCLCSISFSLVCTFLGVYDNNNNNNNNIHEMDPK